MNDTENNQENKIQQESSPIQQEPVQSEQEIAGGENGTAGGKQQKEYRNLKEDLYDRINISVRSLDIIIGVLTAILILLLLYFIVRKYT